MVCVYTNHIAFISYHITPLVINSLRVDTQIHTCTQHEQNQNLKPGGTLGLKIDEKNKVGSSLAIHTMP